MNEEINYQDMFKQRIIATDSTYNACFCALVKVQFHQLCKTAQILCICLILSMTFLNEASAQSEFRLDLAYGGMWHDAEKSIENRNDDWLCWASSAANVLAWTKWGTEAGFANADEIFKYYTEHWTDDPAGAPREAWRWWFTGKNYTNKGAGIIKEGGSFWPAVNFPEKKWGHQPGSLFRGIGQNQLKRDPYLLKKLLEQGYGIVLQIIRPQPDGSRDSHMITLWGFRYSWNNSFKGILVTDSDDSKDNLQANKALNSLVFYPVRLQDNFWWFKYKKKDWKILAAYALLRKSVYDSR